jgi:HAD superfamily hydrolase (TIGR01549 family)
LISTILFDFSGTLVDGKLDVSGCRHAVVELLKSKGYPVSATSYDFSMECALRERRISRLTNREMSFDEVERKTLVSLGITPTQQLVNEIEDLEFEHYTWRIRDGARHVLKELLRNYRLGLISNSVSDAPIRVLREETLLRFFEQVVLSKDVGYRKPNPRIFNYSLKRLGVRAKEAVFVGDSYVQDVLGAKRVGMKTIWLADEKNDSNSGFDGVAETMDEVPDVVAGIE